jgi:hypothetical protein
MDLEKRGGLESDETWRREKIQARCLPVERKKSAAGRLRPGS